MGVPFNRTPEGLLDFRRFGGTLYHRTAFAGATTGQQLLTSTGDFVAITAFFDTGASGVVLSQETAQELSIDPAQFNGTNIEFHDVGVGGGEAFWVSNPFHLGIKDFHGSSDAEDPTGFDYSAPDNPVRVQIRQQPAPNDFFSEPIDVIGVPAMKGKVVVIDPRRAEELNYINSFVYTPGTPYNPSDIAIKRQASERLNLMANSSR